MFRNWVRHDRIARRSRSRRALLVLLVFTAAATVAPPAHAVFPGQNGKIAFATASEIFACEDCTKATDRVWWARQGKRAMPYRLGGAWELGFSPDGAWLAFQGQAEYMRIARADGSGARSAGGGHALAWSPRGGLLAYVGSRGVQLVRADGQSKRLVPNTSDARDVTWAPSGTKLAWTFWPEVGSPVVQVGGVDGSGVRTVASGGFDLSWSAQGWLAYRRGTTDNRSALYVIRPGETEERMLLRSIERTTPNWRDDTEVYSWSPNGRRLAVAWRGHIYVVSARDGEPRRITKPGTGWAYSPTWSPDGSRIAYVDGRAIYVVSPRGGTEQLFTRVPKAEDCVIHADKGCDDWVTAMDWQARPRR